MDQLRPATSLFLSFGLALLAGCSGGGGTAAFTPIAGTDGAYCKTYRAWKVYELDGGGAFDQPNPAALRTWWNAYLIAQETMLQHAPPEIRDEVGVKAGQIRTVLTPLLEKYGFDLKRVRRDGSRAEQAALFGLPPAEVQEAQEAQYAYERRTCGTAPAPPPAEVAFEPGSSSERFCSALRALNSELEKVASSKFDPDALRTFLKSDRFAKVLHGLHAAAPAEIAEDVEADAEWFRTRWNDVVAEYGYDVRGIYLNGTPEDLAVFNRTHPDVLEHAARNTAYEDQVCGG